MKKEDYLITRIRQVTMLPSYWNIESQTAPAVLNMHPARLFVCYIFYTAPDSYQSTVRQRVWDSAAKKVAQALFSDRVYVSRIRRAERREGARIMRLVALLERIDWSACSDDELVRWMKKIKKQWIAYDQATVTAWYVGGDMFHAMASKQLNIPDNDFLVLTTPSAPTHASRYEKDILRAVCAVQKGTQERSRAARVLAKKYNWLPFGYDGPDYWDAPRFEKKLKHLERHSMARNQRQLAALVEKERAQNKERIRLARAHRLVGERKRLVEVLISLAIWTDDRKAHQFRLHYYFDRALRECASRLSVPVKTLKYMFLSEISSAIKDGETVLLGHGARRSQGGFVLEARNGSIREHPKKQADAFIQIFSKKSEDAELAGSIGSRGTKNIYRGTVKVLTSPQDGNKVREGDFIVASMTSPDYIAIMSRAQGFITDEGGVTCHAAIVGREMNKPAIIGTKIATRVLKDGDLVEVDAEKGIVRKIK